MYNTPYLNTPYGPNQLYPNAQFGYDQQMAPVHMYGQHPAQAYAPMPNMYGNYHAMQILPQQGGHYAYNANFGGLQNAHYEMQTFIPQTQHHYGTPLYIPYAPAHHPYQPYMQFNPHLAPAAYAYPAPYQQPQTADPSFLNSESPPFVPQAILPQNAPALAPQDQPEFGTNYGHAAYDQDDLISEPDFWTVDRNVNRMDSNHLENIRPIIENIDSFVHFEHKFQNNGKEYDSVLLPCKRKANGSSTSVIGQLELGFDQVSGRPFHAYFVPQNETKFADQRLIIKPNDKRKLDDLIMELAIPALSSQLSKTDLADSRGTTTFLNADQKK